MGGWKQLLGWTTCISRDLSATLPISAREEQLLMPLETFLWCD